MKEDNNLNNFSLYLKLYNIIRNKFYIKIIKMIILLVFLLLLLKLKLMKSNLFLELYKKFTEDDIKLFMENKTKFYFKVRTRYLKKLHKIYNESNLVTFQDKLNYLLIHESPEYKSNFVDKIKIHKYTKKILGKDICVPILKIYNNFDEINFNELPNKFVLKYNHGSAMNIFCNDKFNFNISNAKLKLNQWKNKNYGIFNTEFQYLYVKRKVFVAPYLCDKIIDYEFFCFNGIPKFIRAQKLLIEKNHTLLHNWYDLNWNLTDIESGIPGYFRIPEIKIEKPKNLDLMINYAKKLSKDFVFVRVDLYEVNNTVYLSELTFTPSNTLMKFKNNEQSLYLGSLLDITKIKKSLYNH